MKISIMQPYYLPYLGYFRLAASADVFVIYDCVQFPRRGWVHRNKLSDHNNTTQWFTLPLKKQDRDTTRICDLCFLDDHAERMKSQFDKFPAFKGIQTKYPELYETLTDIHKNPVDYISESITEIANILNLKPEFVRSSNLGIDQSLKGQDRILAISKYFGADVYINAPGGRDLYNHDDFARSGIELRFLEQHAGKFDSILDRLYSEELNILSKELTRNIAQ